MPARCALSSAEAISIARGSAPLLVAGISVAFLGVVLAPPEVAGILVITAGIMSLGLTRHHDGMRNGGATLLALVTGAA